MILINGRVYAADSAFSVQQAFAVSEGSFLAVGSNEDILNQFEAGLILDAGGKTVLPGLIDGHCHFTGYATNRYLAVNMRGTKSFEEILLLLEEFHQQYPQTWITGAGWDQNDWPQPKFPDNTQLDERFPETPVVLTRIDGHAVLANSAALKIAGIQATTKIAGGKVLVQNGRPTGILLDNAAEMMKAMIPKPSYAASKEAIVKAQYDCFSLGLTSVVDAGLYYGEVRMIDSLHSSGELKIRVNAMLTPDEMNFRQFVEKGTIYKERLTVNSVKLYADGALGSRGALLLEPYSDDPGNYGIRVAEPQELRKTIALAFENGFQVNTHCIGDSANRMVLHLYGEALKGSNDRRWRIEHAQVIHPADFELFSRYSIIPSVQATHGTSDMYWAGERLGPERVKGAYAYKELLNQNGWIINGTDFPVEEINPMLTFYAAVSRQDRKGFPEGGFQPENALSREEALRSMTIWAAKGSFEEGIKGSIEPGKVADFLIIDRDIMQVPIEQVPETKVLKTYLNGELVYELP